MALDYQTALDEYGAIGLLAKTNKDVANVFNQAVAGEWDAAQFERAIWQTNWYKNTNASARQFQLLAATDPKEYANQVLSKHRDIQVQAQAMGKTLTAAQADSIAKQALNGGWDASFMQAYLGGLNNTLTNGRMSGQAGDIENHIRTQFAAYGMQVTSSYLTKQVNAILAGTQTTGGLDNQIIAQASKMFPQFTQDFQEGRTVSDIAQPFIQQMGNVLEIDPSSIDVNDNTIMKALQGDGKTPMTLYQFNQQLKSDPRWQKTDNAKNAAYDTIAQIGKNWGFM